MRKLSWVATTALLLLVGAITSSPVLAQDHPPTAEPLPEAPPAADCGGQPCHLGPAHYDALSQRIEALKRQLADQRALLDGVSKAAEEAEGQPTAGALQAQKQVIETQVTALVVEIKAATEQLSRAASALESRVLIPEWAGFHWGILAIAEASTFTGADNYAVPVRPDLFGRWISRHHLGLEAGIGAGMWFTEDVAPAFFAFRAMGVAVGKHWGAFAGAEIMVLQAPVEGLTALPLVLIPVGGEYRTGNFTVRAWGAPPAHSELKRTSGMWWGLGIGWYN